MKNKYLTAYCDASYNSVTYEGGWGIWIRDENLRILKSGICPSWIRDSNQAEACAIWAAVYSALTFLSASKGKILVVNTDSQSAATWFGWRKEGHKKAVRIPEGVDGLVKRSKELLEDKEMTLRLKWIRGHQNFRANDGAYLNYRVDDLARKARKHGMCKTLVEKLILKSEKCAK